MNWPILGDILNGAGLIITGIVGAFTLYHTIKNKHAIEVVHKATNSMKDELVSEVRKSSKAEGVKEQQDREQGSAK